MPFDPEAYGPAAIASGAPSIQQQHQARIDAVYDQMSEDERAAAESIKREVDLMAEARNRFAKAALYEQLIEGQLFEGDDEVTLEVENEFKEYAAKRMRVLLGIEQEKTESELQLSEEELVVLKGLAAKVLGRPFTLPKPEVAAKLATTRQAAPLPAPVSAPPAGLAAPKRGRGRPPGTGKHQRAAAAAQAVLPPARPQFTRPVPAPVPAPPPQATTRQVTLPNGTVREVSVQQAQVQALPNNSSRPTIKPGASDPKPLPMPSPDEMVAHAQVMGDRGMKNEEAKMRNPENHIL